MDKERKRKRQRRRRQWQRQERKRARTWETNVERTRGVPSDFPGKCLRRGGSGHRVAQRATPSTQAVSPTCVVEGNGHEDNWNVSRSECWNVSPRRGDQCWWPDDWTESPGHDFSRACQVRRRLHRAPKVPTWVARPGMRRLCSFRPEWAFRGRAASTDSPRGCPTGRLGPCSASAPSRRVTGGMRSGTWGSGRKGGSFGPAARWNKQNTPLCPMRWLVVRGPRGCRLVHRHTGDSSDDLVERRVPCAACAGDSASASSAACRCEGCVRDADPRGHHRSACTGRPHTRHRAQFALWKCSSRRLGRFRRGTPSACCGTPTCLRHWGATAAWTSPPLGSL